jgi:hypothetical protein
MRTFPEGGFWKGKNYLFDRRFEQVRAPLPVNCAISGAPLVAKRRLAASLLWKLLDFGIADPAAYVSRHSGSTRPVGSVAAPLIRAPR